MKDLKGFLGKFFAFIIAGCLWSLFIQGGSLLDLVIVVVGTFGWFIVFEVKVIGDEIK